MATASFSTDVAADTKRVTRPRVAGKFLWAGDQKLYVRGVTYGTFRADTDGNEFPARAVVEQDFRLMAAHGINAVRLCAQPSASSSDAGMRTMPVPASP